jgi:hypothetical protein
MIAPSQVATPAKSTAETLPRWGWVEIFVVIQYLSTALLFLPAAQSYRFAIRALPYVSSLGLLALVVFSSSPRKRKPGVRSWRNRPEGRAEAGAPEAAAEAVASPPASGKWVLGALVLLTISLLHPSTAYPAGPAQVVFQLCIAAPIFWVWRKVQGVAHLRRLIWLVFFSNALGVIVGLLQVYYPASFMPPEFSRVAIAMGTGRVQDLTYIGADGRSMLRPPGLSDMPGGAAVAGMTVGFLGVVLASQVGAKNWQRLSCLMLAATGVFVLYLTQVRSLLMMMVVALIAMCFLLWRQKRMAQLVVIASLGAALVVGAFVWAVSIGGKSVANRFLGIIEKGAVTSYKENRGGFLETTFAHYLPAYPLGAGVGRWGMMSVYFPKEGPLDSDSPYAEIQLTGWLLDGGVPMWILYGGAIVVAMMSMYRVAIQRQDLQLSYLAGIIFCLNLFIIGQCFAQQCFNTQLGIQFWFMVSALHGVACRAPVSSPAPPASKAKPWSQLEASRLANPSKRERGS